MGKRAIASWAAWLAAAVLAFGGAAADALAQEADGQNRIVFALDKSGSMALTDPDGVRFEAVRLVIDALSFEGDEAGLVSFDEQGSIDLKIAAMDTDAAREAFKSALGGAVEPSADTDITEGLAAAMEAVKADGRHGRRNASIILLTDGRNDLSEENPKTDEVLEAMLAALLEEAAAEGIAISAIGLDATGQVNEAYLRRIAEATGGSSFMIDSAKELPETVQQIFASEKDTKVETQSVASAGEARRIPVSVPDSSIIETNVNLFSDGVLDLRVLMPDGTDATEMGDKVRVVRSRLYTAIKLLSPEEGVWQILAESAEAFEVTASVIHTRSLQLLPIGLQDSLSPLGRSRFVFAFFTEGARADSDHFYKDAAAELVVLDEAGKETGRHAMQQDVSGFYLDFVPEELFGGEGQFAIACAVSTPDLAVEAGPYAIRVDSSAAAGAEAVPAAAYAVAIGAQESTWSGKEPVAIEAFVSMDGSAYKGTDVQVAAWLEGEAGKAAATPLQIGAQGYYGEMQVDGLEPGAYTLVVEVQKDGAAAAEARMSILLEGRDGSFYVLAGLAFVAIAAAAAILFEFFGRKKQMLNN